MKSPSSSSQHTAKTARTGLFGKIDGSSNASDYFCSNSRANSDKRGADASATLKDLGGA